MTNDKVTEAEIDAVVEAMAVELIGYTDEAARVTARQVVIAVKAASPRPTGDVVEAIAIGMTPHEKLNRALTAAKPHYPGWSIAEVEKSSAYLAVLEALTDLDKATQMTPQEKLIRAQEACAAVFPALADGYRQGKWEKTAEMVCALRALTDLDKPVPDPDEAWRPFLDAIQHQHKPDGAPIGEAQKHLIARIKAALPLIPEQYR